MVLKGYIFGIGYAFLCLFLSLILFKLGVKKWVTRKVVHILVGFEWVILYHYMGAGIHFLAVCIFFLLLLTLAYFKKMMPMISSDDENAPGTVYYAVAMTGVAIVGCFYESVMIPFGLGILATSVGDGLAGVVGKSFSRFNPKIYGNKTLLGTLACFICTFVGAYIMNFIFEMKLDLVRLLAIAVFATVLELVTGLGLDNIVITWGVTALTVGFLNFDWMLEYILPLLLTPLVIAFALKKKSLTKGGVLLAVFFDAAVSISLKNFGFVLLMSFFVGAILIDKIKNKAKKQGRTDESQKGDCRDYMQVLANGLPSCMFALMYLATDNKAFIIGFCASLAEALADTAASGLGIFAHNTFDPLRFKKCDQGLSGGVSFIGTFASFVASYLIGVIAYAFGYLNLTELLIVSIAGFVGALIDSFLGSAFQVKFKCAICGKVTEKKLHCGTATEKYSGFDFIDNDIVNLISGTLASVLAFGIIMLI